jgi:SecD/SecF fusion protein
LRTRTRSKRLSIAATVVLCLLVAACATVAEVLPCWVQVRADYRAHDGQELVTPTTLADASRLVDARLAAYGVAQRTVFSWEVEWLVVGLPNRWATDDVLSLASAPGWVEFVPLPAGEREVEEGEAIPPGLDPLFGLEEIVSVKPTRDALDQPAWDFEFSPRGDQLLGNWSAANIGARLAIVVDGTILSAPTVRSPLAAGRMQLSGAQEPRRLEWLASLLAHGPLPLELEQAALTRVEGAGCPEDEGP